MNLKEKLKKYKLLNYIPFDPIIKRAESEIEVMDDTETNLKFRTTKGAPQVIAELCNLEENLKKKVFDTVDKLAESGYRALGVAVNTGKEWDFIGIIPLYDPPREDVSLAIRNIKNLGIHIKMITGDHIAIAKNIARMLGIGDNIISMNKLLKIKKRI